ncbi:hypothetical protein ACWCL1_04980 [Ligilactobacillus sp. LYQ135]
MKKYKIVKLIGFEKMVKEFIEEYLLDEFEHESSQEIIMNQLKGFSELLKPAFINELETDINDYPEILNNFEKESENVYVSEDGYGFEISEG